MINYEYNITEKRWDFIYRHEDGRTSNVYLRPDLPEREIIKNLIDWFNQILRLRNETSS